MRRDKYEQLYDRGLLKGTIKAARNKARERSAMRPHDPTQHGKVNVHLIQGRHRRMIPLGTGTAVNDYVERLKDYPQHRRKRRWGSPESSLIGCFVRTEDEGRYSSRCTWTKVTYHPMIRSYGWIDREGRLAVRFADLPLRRIKAPHGYRWDKDRNGFRLVANRNNDADYHPTASDLLSMTPRQIAAELRENYTRREAQRKLAREEQRRAKNAVKRAEKEGCRVCLTDSLRAGNCEAGTRYWASRHGLNAANHYRPSEVLDLANGDVRRVALVVDVALRRHRQEMARGHALLADHIWG